MRRPRADAAGPSATKSPPRSKAGIGRAAVPLLLALSCAGPPQDRGEAGPAPVRAAVSGPRLVVLGTAQDGGFPHAACTCVRCEAARDDRARRRGIASLALVLPAGPADAPRDDNTGPKPDAARAVTDGSRVLLVDATPDIRDQLAALSAQGRGAVGRVDRSPVDGVLLTHAHMGHYTGLAFFGFEAVHTRRLPVDCTPRMAAFLRANGPWSQLVGKENILLRERPPGEAFPVGGGVEVTPLAVPHRDEYSDTVGYLFSGPRATVLYVPDTDSWAAWSRPLTERLEGVDLALVDGTFYSLDELPRRSVASIGHPLIVDTMDLLEPMVRSGRLRVAFTHLNHSNPALDPAGPERAQIERRGFEVLAEGAEIAL